MTDKQPVDWYKLDQDFSGLATDTEHEIDVTREAIPIVFVPGIMGSRLQRKGALTDDEIQAGLPRKRWDPGSALWMLLYYVGAPGYYRKLMLIGDRFSSDYLEVIHDKPPTDGFEGIMDDYHEKFLTPVLRDMNRWGPLTRYFDLPVYACGYNWTDKVENAGKAIAQRIKDIITEAKGITGICEKVIVVTHSMGGLVARWASEMEGASVDILGMIHGVQPVTGSGAAYWRMKAGFEDASNIKDVIGASVLGNSGDTVTPVLGNMPGGLSLLPNKLHQTDAGGQRWLKLTDPGQKDKPESDPYSEIYRVPAVVSPDNDQSPSDNAYWGLVDPDLLDPGAPSRPSAPGSNNDLASQTRGPWRSYAKLLKMAELMHDQLQLKHHDRTFCSQGIDHLSPDVVELRATERPWYAFRHYPNHGFTGYFRDASGKRMMAELQNHTGKGDGTVPQFSSGALNKFCKLQPLPKKIPTDHQKAYQTEAIQDFTVQAIVSLCEQYFIQKHG